MRASPSIVPGIDRDVYLVLDDFGLGCDWRETNVEDTDLEAVLNDLLEGQYKNPPPSLLISPKVGFATCPRT